MKKAILLTTLTAALGSAASAQTLTSSFNSGLSGLELGLTAGYANGLSGEIFVHRPNVAGPVGVKVSAAYTNPGDSIRDDVSINPTLGLGTFGEAKTTMGAGESGSHTVVGLDGTYSLGELTPGISATAYAGGRYGMFKANESYTINNKTTTYSMNSFGVGAGIMASYALAGNISLVGDIGVDQFFNGTINASGASNDSWATNETGYNDQRSRFAFPGTVFKAKVGVKLSY